MVSTHTQNLITHLIDFNICYMALDSYDVTTRANPRFVYDIIYPWYGSDLAFNDVPVKFEVLDFLTIVDKYITLFGSVDTPSGWCCTLKNYNTLETLYSVDTLPEIEQLLFPTDFEEWKKLWV